MKISNTHKAVSTILIVDDSPRNLQLLYNMLEDQGHLVRPLQNGSMVVSSVLNSPPDLILLDILMPDMDGFEVCRHLKAEQRTRDIPVIFVSALDDTANKIKGLELGAVDYITKPFQKAEVVARVNTHLALSHLRNHLEEMVAERTAALQREIAERKQTEQKLAYERLRYNLLVAAYRDGIAIINQEHQLVEANGRFAEMLGYSPDEICTLHTWDWDAILTEEDVRTNFADLARTNIVFETRHRRKDGTVFDVEVSACGAKVGKEALVFTISRDITERKRVEEELEHYREHLEELVQKRTVELTRTNRQLRQEIAHRKRIEEELRKAKEAADEARIAAEVAQRTSEDANRAKSEFLSNMSHEIRTPLNAVLGGTELLENLITDAQQTSYLALIKTGGWNLLSLINDILDLSKIEAGKLEILPETVNLRTLVHKLIHVFQMKITEKKLTLQVDIAPDIPQHLFLDGVRLRQILFNVLGNAIKFTEEGNISLRVYTSDNILAGDSPATSPPSNSQSLIFDIEDTGIGIPDDQQQLIFEAFRQQDGQSTRKYGGTGLGLAITKRLVDMMGGTITLTSDVGKGSRFEIVLRHVPIVTKTKQKGASATDSAEKAASPATDLAALPANLLKALEQAAVRGDVDAIETVIADIQEYDALFAKTLKELAEDFDYGKILQLIPTYGLTK